MSATSVRHSHTSRRDNSSRPSPESEKGPPLAVSSYFGWKGILDPLAAALLLIPGLPMIAALVLLVRLTSKGPGIFRQQRVGLAGRAFTMYKLRSMRLDAEFRSGPTWAAPGKDPRVTPLGYWLRKLHLDELPQLFNVLKGDMSLIGPRPERPEFVEVLGRYIHDYDNRLLVAPGITGLAQINLPPDSDLDSVRRKAALDLEYIRTASLALDCRMFLCTLLRMIGLRGDSAMRLMAVDRPVPQLATGDSEVELNVRAGNVRLADLMQSLGLDAEASAMLARARQIESGSDDQVAEAPTACSDMSSTETVAVEPVP